MITHIYSQVQGAVMCGIEKSSMQSLRSARPCKHYYGINVNPLFSDIYHDQRDKIVAEEGVALARGQVRIPLGAISLWTSD